MYSSAATKGVKQLAAEIERSVLSVQPRKDLIVCLILICRASERLSIDVRQKATTFSGGVLARESSKGLVYPAIFLLSRPSPQMTNREPTARLAEGS